MVALTPQLQRKIEVIVGETFQVETVTQDAVVFKNRKLKLHNFYLYCGPLIESEILEIAGILEKTFGSLARDMRISENPRPLNSNTKSSVKLVRAILELDSSPLHKLLLLASGNSIVSEDCIDLVLTLVQNKDEVYSDPEILIEVRNPFNDWQNLYSLYILPGWSMETFLPPRVTDEMITANRGPIELISRLTSFFAKGSESLTLGDHLKLDFAEAIVTKKALGNLFHIKTIQKLLLSKYSALAESMTANEVGPLSNLLSDGMMDGHFSEDVLRNRSIAKSKSDLIHDNVGADTVFMYLSPDEESVFDEVTLADDFNFLLANAYSYVNITPQIIYAAIAEVLAVKGKNKALEVSRSLEHIRLASDLGLSHYEATVALIAEAIHPVDEDIPFAWLAQMSEHSWVLSSHLSEDSELALSV